VSNPLDFQVNGQAGSVVGGLGATVKYFPRLLGPSIGVAPSTPSATSAAGSLFLQAQNVFNGQEFNVIAAGSFGSDSGDPSGTVTIALYGVTGSFTVPVYTQLATTAAIVPFYPNEPWLLSAVLVGSSLPVTTAAPNPNGMLIGYYTSAQRIGINSTPVTVTNVITGLDFLAGNPLLQRGAVLGFVVGVTFGTTSATNTATLNEFTVES
jgi:hypothetical protein